jgi:hypothetical protein
MDSTDALILILVFYFDQNITLLLPFNIKEAFFALIVSPLFGL